jgi:hypothetical protein
LALDVSRPKQLALSWTAPGNGGSPITSYVVYRGVTGTPTLIASVDASTLSYVDVNIIRGVAYSYSVAACNAIGCSPLSASVTGSAH